MEGASRPEWLTRPARNGLEWELWRHGDVWRMLSRALTDDDLWWAQAIQTNYS